MLNKNRVPVRFFIFVLCVPFVKAQRLIVPVNENSFDTTTNPLLTASSTLDQSDRTTLATSRGFEKLINGTQFAINQNSLDTTANPLVTASSTPVQTDRKTLATSTGFYKLINGTQFAINQNSFDTTANPLVTASSAPVQTDRMTLATSRSFDNLTNGTQFAINQNSFETNASPRETNSIVYFPKDRNTFATSTSFDKPATYMTISRNQSSFKTTLSPETKNSATPVPIDIKKFPASRNSAKLTDIPFAMNQFSFETSTSPGIKTSDIPVPTERNTFQPPGIFTKLTTDIQFAMKQSSFEITTSSGIKSTATPGSSDRNIFNTSKSLVKPKPDASLANAQATFETTINPKVKANTATPVSTLQCITNRIASKLPAKEPCEIIDKAFSDRLRQELLADKGYIQEIYLDQNGDHHFGISHKITRKDPEFRLPVGINVSPVRIEESYQNDVKDAFKSCCSLFNDFKNLPDDVQLIILNMRFTLGHTGMAGFASFRQAVNSGDFNKAANEMERSIWYKQVPLSAKRLVDRMRAVAEKYVGCQ
ncbi:hypothetical protein CHS0354_003688 [Potamilus streckersoni]|uniref:Lysozyme n=1 Tax=Potamilus streckersoni TaxID=2493646 RepID=A0AAE0ST49_9BIVA|nr:hypothetical protein CHS0354_003688 [Potamilus streckersoni]